MRKNDDLAAWRLFFRVAELGSISKAAAEIAVEPSSVSRRLSALERRIGAQLLTRATRSLHLTDAGARAYERMRGLVEEMDAVGAELGEHGQALSGHLRITAAVPLGERLLTPWLAAFQREHPAVTAELILSDRPTDLLADRIDLAIRIGPLAAERLVARRIGEMPMVMCASPAYLAAHGHPRKPADLAAHRGLLYTKLVEGEDRLFLEKGGRRVRLELPLPLRINNIAAVHRAALDGAGINPVAPLWLCGEDLRAGRLVRLLPDWAHPPAPAHAVRLPARHTPRRIEAIIDWIAQRWKETPGLDA